MSTALPLPGEMSRRRFLGAAAIGAVAAPVSLATMARPAMAAEPAGRGPASNARPILLKRGCVLTLDRGVGDFENADVLIERGKIVAVKPGITAPNADVIDASRTIVMPGFVDTHRHIWEGILRNVLPDGSLGDYFRVVTGTLGPAYRPEDVYAGNLVSALGAIDAGVTTSSTGRTSRTLPSIRILPSRPCATRACEPCSAMAHPSSARRTSGGRTHVTNIRRTCDACGSSTSRARTSW